MTALLTFDAMGIGYKRKDYKATWRRKERMAFIDFVYIWGNMYPPSYPLFSKSVLHFLLFGIWQTLGFLYENNILSVKIEYLCKFCIYLATFNYSKLHSNSFKIIKLLQIYDLLFSAQLASFIAASLFLFSGKRRFWRFKWLKNNLNFWKL